MKENSPPASGFDALALSKIMMKALKAAGYSQPSPVQAGLIPLAFDNQDVLVQARTGTGKTAAFAIPILEQLAPKNEIPGPQALILVPTRELAVQVRGEFEKLALGQKTNIVAVYGGKPIRGQIEKLRAGAQVVIGTPGRVIDHIERRTLDLHELWCVVLDEADRMLDIGFRPDIEKILKRCPTDRQTLLLSATVPAPIQKLAQKYMRDPQSLDLSPKEISVDTIEQFYFTVDQSRKFELLLRLLAREKPAQAIVFCRTKRSTDRISDKLKKKIRSVDCIHGDMAQGARDRVMTRFRSQDLRVMVATDVIGRGIDVSSVSHIINYDIPAFCDDYVHRVGRTGRMGREGVAFTFVTPEEGGELTRIEDRINRLLKRDEIAGFEATAKLPRAAGAAAGSPASQEEPKAPPPPPELSKRPPKRYRRAL